MLAKGTVSPLWLPVETSMVKHIPVIHTAATEWDTTDGATATFLADGIWQTDLRRVMAGRRPNDAVLGGTVTMAEVSLCPYRKDVCDTGTSDH